MKRILFTGPFAYYDDPIYDRLSAAAYLSGMALGTYWKVLFIPPFQFLHTTQVWPLGSGFL